MEVAGGPVGAIAESTDDLILIGLLDGKDRPVVAGDIGEGGVDHIEGNIGRVSSGTLGK
jgi:hypothetical protein